MGLTTTRAPESETSSSSMAQAHKQKPYWTCNGLSKEDLRASIQAKGAGPASAKTRQAGGKLSVDSNEVPDRAGGS